MSQIPNYQINNNNIFENSEYITYLLIKNQYKPLDKDFMIFILKAQEVLKSQFSVLQEKAKQQYQQRKQQSSDQQNTLLLQDDLHFKELNTLLIQYVKDKQKQGKTNIDFMDFKQKTNFSKESKFQSMISDELAPTEEIEQLKRQIQGVQASIQQINNSDIEEKYQQKQRENYEIKLRIQQVNQNCKQMQESIKKTQEIRLTHDQTTESLRIDLESIRNKSVVFRKEFQKLNRKLENYQRFTQSVYQQLYQKQPNDDFDLQEIYQNLLGVIKQNQRRFSSLNQIQQEMKMIRKEFQLIKKDLQFKTILNDIDNIGMTFLQKYKFWSVKQSLKPTINRSCDHSFLQVVCFDQNSTASHPNSRIAPDLNKEIKFQGEQLVKTLEKGQTQQFIDCTESQLQNALSILKKIQMIDKQCVFSCYFKVNDDYYDGVKQQTILNSDFSNLIRVTIQNDYEYQKVIGLLRKKVLTQWDEFFVLIELSQNENEAGKVLYRIVAKKQWENVLQGELQGIVFC